MSSTSPATLTRDLLVAEYHDYGRPPDDWMVGIELERHLLREDGLPLPYSGVGGVRELLETMAERGGWEIVREGEDPIALRRGRAWITLEPGAQVELSGSPHHTIGALRREAEAVTSEIRDALNDPSVHQVGLGFTPFASIDSISWVPKGRYGIMKRHLIQRGDLAHHMMKGTAAVQASYDFSDEEDCARKARLSILLAPLTTAIFANSPLVMGRPVDWASYRGHIWTRTDPARTGLPTALAHFSFERWVDYLLDVPMMFTHTNGHWADAEGRSFREWMRHGIDGVYPTRTDWDLHLTSVFPEVRVKRTIEVRGGDGVPLELATSFAALFAGLFYDSTALDEGTELASRFASHGSSVERFEEACRRGLAGTIGERSLLGWAEELVEIARRGLRAFSPEDATEITPLVDLLEHGESPCMATLRAWRSARSPADFLRALPYAPNFA